MRPIIRESTRVTKRRDRLPVTSSYLFSWMVVDSRTAVKDGHSLERRHDVEIIIEVRALVRDIHIIECRLEVRLDGVELTSRKSRDWDVDDILYPGGARTADDDSTMRKVRE